MNILQRRRELILGGKPYDAEIEWMSNNGTAYIDTGIVPTDTPRIVISFRFVSIGADRDIFGFLSNTQPSFIGNITVVNGTQTFKYYRYYTTTSKGPVLDSTIGANTFAEWDMGYDVKLNGVTLASYNRSSFSTNTQKIWLFRGRSVVVNDYQVAYAKIYDGNTLMRDFIPVRVGTTGYMYDRVSGQLFGNAGTGDFILGNDI